MAIPKKIGTCFQDGVDGNSLIFAGFQLFDVFEGCYTLDQLPAVVHEVMQLQSCPQLGRRGR